MTTQYKLWFQAIHLKGMNGTRVTNPAIDNIRHNTYNLGLYGNSHHYHQP